MVNGKKRYLFLMLLVLIQFPALKLLSQVLVHDSTVHNALDFVSDTQQPMMVEKIFLHSNHNLKATSIIFTDIAHKKPKAVFMLGDIVALGYSNRRWKKVDQFIENCRKEGTTVFGVLGNHDVMGNDRKGERNFQKRFPEHIRTGYYESKDSIAVVMVNSNFGRLTSDQLKFQLDWYQKTIKSLDADNAIKAVIVTCHHAPYSNSTVIKPSEGVQKDFVPAYINSKKGCLFITGHAHAFEHFKQEGKDFLVIGGGGGLHQPLKTGESRFKDLASAYKPMFHYLQVFRQNNQLEATSFFVKDDFSGIQSGYSFSIPIH